VSAELELNRIRATALECLPPSCTLESVELTFLPISIAWPAGFAVRVRFRQDAECPEAVGWEREVVRRVRETWSARDLGLTFEDVTPARNREADENDAR